MRLIMLLCLLLSLQGCGGLTNGTWTGTAAFSNDAGNGTQVIVANADQRLILNRQPVGRDPNIICSEPSPDIAKAFQAALQASGSAPSGPQAALQFSSNEAITALAGRTPTVVALRDGLFRACEAYANGQIGKIGYALILSQYGDTLTTLMLGEAAATAASASPGASASDKANGGAGATMATPTVNLAVNAPAGTQPAAAAAAAQKPATDTGGGSASPTVTPAAAVQTIAQGYFLTLPSVALNQALLVSCLLNNDPTMTADPNQNKLLSPTNCAMFITTAQKDGLTITQAMIAAEKSPAQTQTGGPKPAPGLSPTTIKAVQKALLTLGCGPVTVDGAEGPETDGAVGTCVDGNKINGAKPPYSGKLTAAIARAITAAAPPVH